MTSPAENDVSQTWHRVPQAAELAGAGPHAITAGGVDLVLVRSPRGPRVYEGRCPHQGALLGEGDLEGGELYVQTDVAERADQYEEQVLLSGHFAPAGDAPGSARMAENPYGARSPREHRAIKDGLPVNRLRFVRRPASGLAGGSDVASRR